MQNFVKKADHQINGAGMQILPLQLWSNDLILDWHHVFYISILMKLKMPQIDT